MKKNIRTFVAVVTVFAATPPSGAAASDLFIYPTEGQSAEQQQKDRYECHVWASEQTGFDPSLPAKGLPQPPAGGGTQSNIGGNLVGGAALGTAIGAIAGKDIAESAAIGAGANILRSQLKTKRSQKKAQKAYEADIALNQAHVAAKRADYDRARSACLTGRGYTVN